MTEYLSDYPELAKKVENRLLGADNIQTIVAEYNYWYNNKTKDEKTGTQIQSNN